MKINLKDLNFPDWLSLYRVIAAPLLLILIFTGRRELFSWLLLLSYFTDLIDGTIARMYKMTSVRGSIMDSIGDQITFGVALTGLLVFESDFIFQNYLPIVGLLTLYGIQMFYAYLKYDRLTAFHTYMAKLSAISQGIFILWLLFFAPVYWLFYTMLIIGTLETLEEILLIRMCDTWTADIKGVYWLSRRRKQDQNS